MEFVFENRPPGAPLVQTIWRTQSEHSGTFDSVAVSHWELVFMRIDGKLTITLRGPETRATCAESPANAEFFGLQFRLGAFIPDIPMQHLVDTSVDLPLTSATSFWFLGSHWELPTFDNADTFVSRLIRRGQLAFEPVVEAAMQGQAKHLSLRSVQRRFIQTTGLTYKRIEQIERARQAVELLQQGMSIIDTAYDLGFVDQSHLTNALRHFVGQTPAQILKRQ